MAGRIHTLSKELGIAVGEEVDDGSRVGLLAADVLVADLKGDEGPTGAIVSDVIRGEHLDFGRRTASQC